MNNGWIKLHRKITEWEWYNDANTFRLFMHLLLTANHETRKWKGIVILPGQKITSYGHLSDETGLSPQSVRTAINRLKSTGELTYTTTSKYGCATISNWKKYQIATDEPTNEQQASNRPVTTNKNVRSKEVKNTEGAADAAGVVSIIDAFKEWNPAAAKWYKNTTQREAASRLLQLHGQEKLIKVVALLPKSNRTPYFPQVSTLSQLEDKWSALEAAFIRKKTESEVLPNKRGFVI